MQDVLSIRIDRKLKRRLTKAAKADGRSTASLIRALIWNALSSFESMLARRKRGDVSLLERAGYLPEPRDGVQGGIDEYKRETATALAEAMFPTRARKRKKPLGKALARING